MKRNPLVMAGVLAMTAVLLCSCAGKKNNTTPPAAHATPYRAAVPMTKEEAKNFGMYNETEKIRLSGVVEKRRLPFDFSRELVYSHSICTFATPENKSYGSSYSVYDSYYNENKSEHAQFLQGTSLMTFYEYKYTRDTSLPKKTEEELKALSAEFLESIVSMDYIDKLYYVPSKLIKDEQGRCKFTYERRLGRYSTDETVSIYIDEFGTVYRYEGPCVKKYRELGKQIPEARINVAYSSLTNRAAELGITGYSHSDFRIITSVTGVPYLELTYNDEKAADGEGKLVARI